MCIESIMGNTRQLIPVARKDRLVIEEVPGETLIYDLETHKAHSLNLTAALVWKHCDGEQTVEQVAFRMEEELGMPFSRSWYGWPLTIWKSYGFLKERPEQRVPQLESPDARRCALEASRPQWCCPLSLRFSRPRLCRRHHAPELKNHAAG